MKTEKISELTIKRLSIYLRCLKELADSKIVTTSSQTLAEQFQLNSAQIRKDLTYFGQFGERGVGYNVEELQTHLTKILGLETQHRIGIVGAGRLGMALASYIGFDPKCFKVVALFDKDNACLGMDLRSGVYVYHIKDLREIIIQKKIVIGVVAVPESDAQEVVDQLTEAGITAILNFAPVRLNTENGIKLKTMDLAKSFESLSYYLSNESTGDKESTVTISEFEEK
ncbi:MAG: redox-sensing transcriptional repressor Rex [Acidobacteriia bacterium]|jgi:redox-sensing transcriptional repressor|nr:redox-sensing transcriptional repressor Rex [Terriglobia bacterium]